MHESAATDPADYRPLCGSRVRHPSRAEALAAARKLTKKRDARGKDRVILWVFQCVRCSDFHLGSESNDHRRAKKAAKRNRAEWKAGGEDE